MAKQALTQPNMRRFISPVDQFGRPWSMCIEVLTGDPTGTINPGSLDGKTLWDDPLRTPQDKVELERQGQATNIAKCVVRFDRWIDERTRDEEEWLNTLHEIALSKYTSISPEQARRLEQDRLLLKLAGPKPWPSSDLLKKARDGYQPYLGLAPLSPADRVALKRLTMVELHAGLDLLPPSPEEQALTVAQMAAIGPIPEKYQEFVQWTITTGQAKNLKEAAAMWKDHQQALATA